MRYDAHDVRRALTDIPSALRGLRLEEGKQPNGGGALVLCPRHAENKPSCSVTLGPDRTIRIKCFGCDLAGDVFALIAEVHGLDPRRDFPRIVELGAELAGLDGREAHAPPRRSVPPPPTRTYPPVAEVSALWASSLAVEADLQVSALLAGRELIPEMVASLDLARVIPPVAVLPRWATYRGASWRETGHRLIIPMLDAEGIVRSVRAWRILDGDSPKRLPPAGHLTGGLIMANPTARALLAATAAARNIIIAEGEPDFLTWAIRAPERAVLGIVSGSWTDAIAERIPSGSRVVVRTDHDEAGDKYAAQVNRTLHARCTVLRARPDDGR